MGKLIVIEGLDGSGKGTQGKILYERLKEKYDFVRPLTFPDYESNSSAAVKMYLNGDISENPMDINPYGASSFFAVDRYISYLTKWKTDYENGCIFLADRYTTSNAVYQVGKAKDKNEYLNWVWDYEYNKLGLPKPDLVIYLDMDPAVSAKLLLKRYDGNEAKKDIHEKDINFLKNCRKDAMIVAENNGWKIIKCSSETEAYTIDEIAQKVYDLAIKCIEEKI